MEIDRLKTIKEILSDEIFHYGNFEFKLWRVAKTGYNENISLDFHVYNPNDEPFSYYCITNGLYKEINEKFFKYFQYEGGVRINIYDKEEKLEEFYITDDFIDGLFDTMTEVEEINYNEDSFTKPILKIRQIPLKIELSGTRGVQHSLNLKVYAKYIDHEVIYSLDKYKEPLNKPGVWENFKKDISIIESWYDTKIYSYLNKFPSMWCLNISVDTEFI